MMDRIKKVIVFFAAGRILRFLCIFFCVFYTSQTKNDVGILREEILDKMQYENRNVEELLKYYSKISPYESKILNIKFLFLKGDYEEALTELFSLKNIAEVDKDSEKFFQYQCLYGQVCQTLGLKTELAVVRKNLKDSKYLKGGAFAELALDNSSFEIFTLDERLAILRSVIKNDKGKNNDASLIQANIWLAEILGKDNQESKIALDSALSLINKSDSDIYYKILADNYIAKIYLKRNNARAAFDLLKKYQNSAVYLSNAGLKVDFFKNLAISSASVGEFANLDHINRYYFKIVEDQNAKRAVARAKLVNHINKANEEKLESQNDLFRNICIVIFLFLICAIAIYYFYRIKKKRAEVSVTEEEDPKSFVIPDKTEKRILSKLEEFEKSQKYIQKKVSLKMLAQQFDTNPTYLSEIINKHKNSNFNSYINNLRIDYIVDKINENLEYRKYKVSYLADECGFSSHSLFTTVFKSRMNVSPTEFLQKLNE